MITFRHAATLESADVLAVGFLAGSEPGPGFQPYADALGWLPGALEAEAAKTDAGCIHYFPTRGELPVRRVAVVGLGDAGALDHEAVRRAAGSLASTVTGATTIATTLHEVLGARPVVEGIALGSYRFDRFHRPEDDAPRLASVVLVGGAAAGLPEGEITARAVCTARDLINTPPGDKPPAWLADEAARLGAEAGVACEVWDEARVVAERLGGIEGVGRGSENPPRLVRMHWKPDGAVGRLAFVGKGITFDTGGISLKTNEGMLTMKGDMSGAAAAVCATTAIARLGLPVEVVAFACLAENMPSGRAIRPSDVLTIRNGTTVEVTNTDAEGRLVLADGISLAVEEEPDLIVDIATLTGHCRVALGDHYAGVFASDDAVAKEVLEAANRAGERMWHMPLARDYKENLKSEVADLRNTSNGRYGGAINAAVFLAEFADGRPWAHIDMPGPAFVDKTADYRTAGGTGFGVRTLIAIAELRSR